MDQQLESIHTVQFVDLRSVNMAETGRSNTDSSVGFVVRDLCCCNYDDGGDMDDSPRQSVPEWPIPWLHPAKDSK